MSKCDCTYGVDSTKFQDFYANKGVIPGTFKLKPVSIEDVKKELEGLDAQKSTGLDNISPRF